MHQTRDEELRNQTKTSLMTSPTYHRPLQTALDDTVSGGKVGAIECRGSSLGSNPNVVGFVTLGAGLHKREVPVYDGAGWAPDVSKVPRADRRVWVLAES